MDTPYIPPYWGLGLHLCRKSDNATQALAHIQSLNQKHPEGTSKDSSTVIYDSDCIDEDLRSPFGLTKKFLTENSLPEIVDFLKTNATKKILLTQKMAIPWNVTAVDTSEVEDVWDMLVLDKSNQSDIHPFVGYADGRYIVYPDVLHPNTFANLTQWGFDFGNIPYDGLILPDNVPTNEKANEICGKHKSFLERFLFNGTTLTDPFDSFTWGSICPQMVHTVSLNADDATTTEKTHLEVHNVYGQEAIKKIRDHVLQEKLESENLMISSSSLWTEGLYYGARNGMPVIFSWIGLRESLAHYLQNFVLAPFSGTPICGSFVPNDTHVFDDDLCLRWYQLGLLLPFAYHSYG
jgi:hypothetical protein